MNEGGQSSTGQVSRSFTAEHSHIQFPLQLIDFMIKTHPAYSQLKEVADERKTNIHTGGSV